MALNHLSFFSIVTIGTLCGHFRSHIFDLIIFNPVRLHRFACNLKRVYLRRFNVSVYVDLDVCTGACVHTP